MSEQSEIDAYERQQKEFKEQAKRDREARDRIRASGLGFGRVVWMIAVGILLAHSILAVTAYVIFTVYSDVL